MARRKRSKKTTMKSLGQPFDDAIFTGLDTFASKEIIQRKISKGFRYRLPIYFKN